MPVVICITFPCEARAVGDTAIPLENRDKKKEGERTVSLSTGKEAPQDALLSTESIEVRHLVPKGFLSIRQTGIYWLAMKNIASAFI